MSQLKALGVAAATMLRGLVEVEEVPVLVSIVPLEEWLLRASGAVAEVKMH